MVMVDINEELYSEIKPIVEANKIEYPTLQNFVNKAVKALVLKEKKR